MISRRKGRRLAVQALYSWDVGKTDPSALTAFQWYDAEADDDLTFPALLVRGTIQECEAVDRLISEQLEHWDISRIARVELAILRVSAYALRFQPDIPSQVTIDEAVELAKELASDDSYRFVNGVLDGIRRRLQSVPDSGGGA